ncbi:bifunctional metallophosphatase/5'-nucleotidase [Bacteroides intestinalis]|jgi:2',3'-cyclic-nucleotide 2'-phosphodiesterase/3'-nucleotidase|uniref:Bifunctional metallophosphatase/5'-nucleotidase n=1 Tax=Bacteroides intestinalis TaxID=329854 RepID=A0A415N9E5_9BACE|nr:bifunctional metallophosphatase/5'-nucleotidase [Bacteroides intestinalis]RHL93234.1 bifunctional metallophosphatase/5'-nucleotidase [Bacteroides intestinalis]
MKRFYFFLGWIFFLTGAVLAQDKIVKLKIVETSDIHGNYYPYDFILRHEAAGSLARVYEFVQKERETYKDNLLLLDNGDILQGQPCAYYYNYIDTISLHLAAEVLNYMKYNAGNMGNHDVETGRAVFDRWAGDCNFPILGANIIDTVTGKTHFKPYEVLERDGVKIVVLGMITPAIPVWLSENLWKGLRFDDMEETARKWMKIIREKENPDLVIGIFHAGQDALLMGGKYRENASLEVARNVPGFDIVLMGHDHTRELKKIKNVEGDSVLIMDPASKGGVVANADVTLKLRKGKVVEKHISGVLTEMKNYTANKDFMARFAPQFSDVRDFVSKKIGSFTETISTRPAYFGSSAFIDLIHMLQLEITNAEISLAAPLSYDTEISKGDVFVSDMFNLYKYENMLYTMKLSGKEIKDALEMSYDLWTNQMKSPDDHLLLLREKRREGATDRASFKNFSFNFDSAAGIIYTVDVTKPKGEKVTITSMADGTPFSLDKMYKVALNSYRGNGGGELLTKGSGISQDELKDRILYSTDKDLRYYLMQYIEKKGVIEPHALGLWKFIPEEWVEPAAKRDYEYLFGKVEK